MKLFLDSIDVSEIKKYSAFGIIDGITTNPTLISSSTLGFYKTVKTISTLTKGDVSVSVISSDLESIIKEGHKILNIASNIVIKLPITLSGLEACLYFTNLGYKVNMTLCFSVNQALLAAKAGATYISPFIGRLYDIGLDGVGLINQIKIIYNNYKFNTQILAASIRTVEHVKQAALCGVDVATIPVSIVSQLIFHPLTDSGIKKFSSDWLNSGFKI